MALSAGEITAVLKLRDELTGAMGRAMAGGVTGFGLMTKAADLFDNRTLSVVDSLKSITGFSQVGQILAGGMQSFQNATFGVNAQLETTELQFATLMGSAERAKNHVADLFEIAKKTPFETTQIITASRHLQTFGGDALNTKANIMLMGDAAAATNAPIEQLGFWVGRAYSSIKNGQPFGEAAMRLQEMAVLSGETRLKMDALQKSGASTTEVWGAFTEALGKHKGAMERMAGTWQGVTSTFTDTINIVTATAFKPFFALIRDGFKTFNEIIGDDKFSDWASQLASVISGKLKSALTFLSDAFNNVRTALSGMGPFILSVRNAFERLSTGLFLEAWYTLVSVARSVSDIFDQLSGMFDSVGDSANVLNPIVDMLLSAFKAVTGAARLFYEVLAAVLVPIIGKFAVVVLPLVQGLKAVFDIVAFVIGGLSDLVNYLRGSETACKVASAAFDSLITPLRWLVTGFTAVAEGVSIALDLFRSAGDRAGTELPKVGKAARDLPKSIDPASNSFDVMTGRMREANSELGIIAGDGMPGAAAAAEALSKAAAKSAEEYKKFVDTLKGVEVFKDAEQWVRALGDTKAKLGGIAKLTAAELDKYRSALKAAHEQAVAAEGSTSKLALKYAGLLEEIKKYTDGQVHAVTTTADFTGDIMAQADAIDGLDRTITFGADNLRNNMGGALTHVSTLSKQAIADFKQMAIDMKLPAFNLPDFNPGTGNLNKPAESDAEEKERKKREAAATRLAAHVEGFRVVLSGMAKGFEQLAQIAGDSMSDTVRWIGTMISTMNVATEAGQNMKAGLDKGGVAGFTQMGVAAIAAAGAILQATSTASKAKNVMGGMMAGASAGAAFGPWGIAAGAAVGLVTGLFRKTTDEAAKSRAALLEQVGGIENLKKMAEEAGVSIEKMMSTKSLKEFEAEQKKVNAAVKHHADLLAQMAAAADTMKVGFAAVTTELTSGFGAVGKAVKDAHDELKKAEEAERVLMNTGKASGDELVAAKEKVKAAVMAVVKSQVDQAAAGKAAEQTLKDLGTQGVATFAATLIATGSYNAALKAVGPTMATLQQAYKDLGLNVDDVATKHLMIQSTVAQANPSLMAAIDGQAGAMQGMAQMGLLNVDTFGAMQRTGMELYTRLQSAVNATGGETRDALMPMQGYLQQAARQAELLGIPLDANTQELINQSVALGIWKDKGKSANDLLIEGMAELVRQVGLLLSNLLGTQSTLGNLPSPTVTITEIRNTIYTDEDRRTGEGGDNEPPYASGTLGRHGTFFRDFGKQTAVYLHGDEAVVRRDQIAQFVAQYGGGAGVSASAPARGDSAGMNDEIAGLRSDFNALLPRAIGRAVRDAMLVTV